MLDVVVATGVEGRKGRGGGGGGEGGNGRKEKGRNEGQLGRDGSEAAPPSVDRLLRLHWRLLLGLFFFFLASPLPQLRVWTLVCWVAGVQELAEH